MLRLAIGIAVLLNAAAMTVEIEAELQLGRLRQSPVMDGVMGNKKGQQEKEEEKNICADAVLGADAGFVDIVLPFLHTFFRVNSHAHGWNPQQYNTALFPSVPSTTHVGLQCSV